MKLTKEQQANKNRLVLAVDIIGFREACLLTDLSGGTLGIYCGRETARCIPESKLKLVEMHLECMNQRVS